MYKMTQQFMDYFFHVNTGPGHGLPNGNKPAPKLIPTQPQWVNTLDTQLDTTLSLI